MVSSRKISSRLRLTPFSSKSGQPFSTILAAIALRMSLPCGSFNRGQDVTRQRCRFNLHAAGARNLREHFAQRLLGRLHLDANALAALELRGEILRSIYGCDFAFVDDDHAIARHAHFGQDVRRENDRVIPGEILDQVADFDDLLGIEAHGRLVEDDYIRIVHERLRQSDALLISAREALDQLIALICDVRLFKRIGNALRPLFRGTPLIRATKSR